MSEHDNPTGRALTILEGSAEYVCFATCPSVWKTADGPPPHDRECRDAHQAVVTVADEIARLRKIINVITGPPMMLPVWIVGRPTAPGIWVLRMKNRDLVTTTVRWDEYEADDTGSFRRYLRIDDGEMSEELDRVEGEIGRWVAMSFGPIPSPGETNE